MAVDSEGQGPQVTFVGGRAIEQTESLDSTLEPDTREAAKEAVRKAIQEAGEKSAEDAKSDRGKDPYKPVGTSKDAELPERGPDGKFLPKDDNPAGAGPGPKKSGDAKDSEDEPLELDKATVKQLLKQREKVAAMKRDAKDEISKERQALQEEFRKIQEASSWIRDQHAQIERDRQAIMSLKKDPARAVREAGWDPEQFILDLAQEGTPEGQAKRQHMELQRQLEEIKQWKESQAQAAAKAQEEAYMRQAQEYRQHAVNTFLKLGMDEDKYPHVSNFYKGKEKFLIAAGDLTAEEYRNLSGKEGSYEQILDYLEDELAESSKSWYSKQQTFQKARSVPVASQKESPKAKGKSLNPEFSGERRSTAQSLKDLDGEERLDAAKQAVRVALAASGKE